MAGTGVEGGEGRPRARRSRGFVPIHSSARGSRVHFRIRFRDWLRSPNRELLQPLPLRTCRLSRYRFGPSRQTRFEALHLAEHMSVVDFEVISISVTLHLVCIPYFAVSSLLSLPLPLSLVSLADQNIHPHRMGSSTQNLDAISSNPGSASSSSSRSQARSRPISNRTLRIHHHTQSRNWTNRHRNLFPRTFLRSIPSHLRKRPVSVVEEAVVESLRKSTPCLPSLWPSS